MSHLTSIISPVTRRSYLHVGSTKTSLF